MFGQTVIKTWIGLAVFSGVMACAHSAFAESLRATLSGAALSITSPCAKQVTIDPAPSAARDITVVAAALHPEETRQIVMASGDTASIRSRLINCWKPADDPSFESTLVIHVLLPARLPITIEEDGAADYDLTAPVGPLKYSASGSVGLKAKSLDALDAQLSGSTTVEVGELHGPGRINMSGQGTASLHLVDADTVLLDLSGDNKVNIEGGKIKKLKVDGSGQSGLLVSATVDEATVSLSGLTTVLLSKVLGAVEKHLSGAAYVKVGG